MKTYLYRCIKDDVFFAGLIAGFILSGVINILPVFYTWQHYNYDSFEVIGFPFPIRKFGGFSGLGSYQFDILMLIADIIFALIVSFCLAYFIKTITVKTKKIRATCFQFGSDCVK